MALMSLCFCVRWLRGFRSLAFVSVCLLQVYHRGEVHTDRAHSPAIHAIVASADLSTTTKSGIREALQAKFPKVDLLARKELVQGEISAAVASRG